MGDINLPASMAVSGILCSLWIWVMFWAGRIDYYNDTNLAHIVLWISSVFMSVHWLACWIWFWTTYVA